MKKMFFFGKPLSFHGREKQINWNSPKNEENDINVERIKNSMNNNHQVGTKKKQCFLFFFLCSRQHNQ